MLLVALVAAALLLACGDGGSSGLIWTSICTGANHACGVRADGALPAGGRIAGANRWGEADPPA